MKTILCYGDSNTWGAIPLANFDNVGRFGTDTRWGSVVRATLGVDYWVVEEGLPARTTVWPDPIEGEYKSGKSYLLPCLESHSPIDLVVLMLGTNDLKHKFGLSASDIAQGAAALIDIIQRSSSGPGNSAPKVLLVCPSPVATLTLFADMFAGSAENHERWLCITPKLPLSVMLISWTRGSTSSPVRSMAFILMRPSTVN